jgi:Flp pilus assembly protein TadG
MMFPAVRGADRERGASAVEMALLTPLLVLLIMLVVQFAMYYHAQHIAVAAAQAGARVARTEAAGVPETDWQGEATAKADRYIGDLGPRLLEAPRTAAVDAGDQVGVEVSAHAVQVVPFLRLRVRARSVGPIERFEADAP